MTIFTYGNHSKKINKDALPDGKVASRLFMEVAYAVLRSGLDGRLKKTVVESLTLQCRPTTSNKER